MSDAASATGTRRSSDGLATVRRLFRDRPIIPLLILLAILVGLSQLARPGIVTPEWVGVILRASVPLDTVSLTEVQALDTDTAPASHSISVYGADHPGIVHGVAELLAREDVNVVGLSTRVLGEDDAPIYVMLLEVTLPASLDEAGLERLLAEVAEQQGVDVSVRPADGDVL